MLTAVVLLATFCSVEERAGAAALEVQGTYGRRVHAGDHP